MIQGGNDPATFWRLVAQLVPREIEAKLQGDLIINIVKYGDTDDQPPQEA